ncbi:MAG: hypothetical protein RMH97_06165 [Verrucomicrobiales bacterium]|nr:hypothetical protein [Verrucomicrobiales bacterium]
MTEQCDKRRFLSRLPGAEFTLPFSVAATVVAARATYGWPGWRTLLLILAGLACAHLFALGCLRLAERVVPGTAGAGFASNYGFNLCALGLCLLSGAGFIAVARWLGGLCFYLAPGALGVTCLCLVATRNTYFAHIWRGVAVGLAPIGAWLGVKGASLTVLEFVQMGTLALAVVLWTTGFDIVYSLGDSEFARGPVRRSLPAVWGPANALGAAFILHMLSLALLIAFGLFCRFRIAYLTGWLIVTGCFVIEYWIARRRRLGWAARAFCRLNAVTSAVLVTVTVAEVVFAGGFKLQ